MPGSHCAQEKERHLCVWFIANLKMLNYLVCDSSILYPKDNCRKPRGNMPFANCLGIGVWVMFRGLFQQLACHFQGFDYSPSPQGHGSKSPTPSEHPIQSPLKLPCLISSSHGRPGFVPQTRGGRLCTLVSISNNLKDNSKKRHHQAFGVVFRGGTPQRDHRSHLGGSPKKTTHPDRLEGPLVELPPRVSPTRRRHA